jgi:hypothetical protein
MIDPPEWIKLRQMYKIAHLNRQLIWPERITKPQTCHPERSVAESKDLRLLFGRSFFNAIVPDQ